MLRFAILAALATAGLSTIDGAQAQVYDRNYPVCLQVYGLVNYTECRYATLAQCQQTASGRAASCSVNPYFASASVEQPRRRRHRDY